MTLLVLATVTAVAYGDEVGSDEIAGVVVDESGQPIQGAAVDAWTWYTGNETKTDKDGKFHLKKLREDRPVELKISKAGYSPWYNVAQPLGVNDWPLPSPPRPTSTAACSPPTAKPVPNALIRANCGPSRIPVSASPPSGSKPARTRTAIIALLLGGHLRVSGARAKVGVLRTFDNTVGGGRIQIARPSARNAHRAQGPDG
jgi:hypothetical protein